MKKILQDYFTFSKKERNAAIILLLLIGSFIALPYLYQSKQQPPTHDTTLETTLATLIAVQQTDSQPNNTYQNGGNWQTHTNIQSNTAAELPYELFNFNPNSLNEAGWKKLGLPEKTIRTICNYRNKGGKFHQPEDIRKIWGLSPQIATRIIPYAQIPAQYPATSAPKNAPTTAIATSKQPQIIDINTATPEMLRSLPTIPVGICYRIVKFRDKLGGFLSVEQVKETYGLTDSVYQAIAPFIKIQTAKPKQLNINTATEAELSAHPYINRFVAKAIIDYRTNKGNFKTLTDLQKIGGLRPDALQKITPYLTAD